MAKDTPRDPDAFFDQQYYDQGWADGMSDLEHFKPPKLHGIREHGLYLRGFEEATKQD
tara:strand:- start:2066 stop:2239 length:174 start_codon:yes stop_codon:yes gene_type:complete